MLDVEDLRKDILDEGQINSASRRYEDVQGFEKEFLVGMNEATFCKICI